MKNKSIYKSFCQNCDEIPIFSQYWWLDSVLDGHEWDVLVYEMNNNIVASMPYYIKKKLGLKLLIQPKFTQKLGPFIMSKYQNEYLKILEYFLDNMPIFNFYSQNWNSNLINWLPFYWRGYGQTTSYSSVIENLDDHNLIVDNFKQNRKQDFTKAQREKFFTVFDIDPLIFYNEHIKNLKIKNNKIFYNFDVFKKLHDNCVSRSQGTIAGTKDKYGNFHSLAFIVWDKNYGYLNQLTTNSTKIKNGSSSLLIKDILFYLRGKTKNFDFEGSMSHGIYNFYRSFGSKSKQMMSIKKSNPSFLNKLIEISGITSKHKKNYE